MGRWARWLPGAALGVFIARVLGEAVGLPGVGAAVALSEEHHAYQSLPPTEFMRLPSTPFLQALVREACRL